MPLLTQHGEMSTNLALSPDHVCYVHCNFCNTILAVNVPSNSLHNLVTVRCGHCASLLSVNLGATHQALPTQFAQNNKLQEFGLDYGSSSKVNRMPLMSAFENYEHQLLPMRSPDQKRQRAPSAYNRFIKEEIQRIKANNPDISHREAFSAAAKNWAHLPRIHFELTLEANKHVKIDAPIAAEGMGKAQGLY